jgi:REP element-mobilizing transposase RayT
VRTARNNFPGVVHHLTWRFIEGRFFFDSRELRDRYLWLLGRALDDSDWRCMAYALMSNHIHIVALAGREPLATWTRRVNLPFAQIINENRNRIGPVFANRAGDRAIETNAVGRVIGYVHNNPVRARLVERARDSSWTSHRAYIHPDVRPLWLDHAIGLGLAGFKDTASFEAFVDSQPDEPAPPDMLTVARAARQFGQLNTATPFGRQVPLVIRPFARLRVDPCRVVELVSNYFDLGARITSRAKEPTIRTARIVAVHCGIAAGLTGADMASVLGLSQQAVSKIVRYAKRDDSICEAVCAQLLLECRAASSA